MDVFFPLSTYPPDLMSKANHRQTEQREKRWEKQREKLLIQHRVWQSLHFLVGFSVLFFALLHRHVYKMIEP